jgi:NTP pyrophosphatase (non-canonical NTP hydrolase)
MAAAGEMGELVAEFQWLTPEQSAAVMDDPEAALKIKAELGDVMIYLTRLADVLGVDLVQAALDKLADSARRYPADGVRGSATSSTGTEAVLAWPAASRPCSCGPASMMSLGSDVTTLTLAAAADVSRQFSSRREAVTSKGPPV